MTREPEAPPSHYAFAHADSAADRAERELRELVRRIATWLEEGHLTRERVGRLAAEAVGVLEEVAERRELAYQAFVAERLQLMGLESETADVLGEDERLPEIRNEEAAERLDRTWDSRTLSELFQEEVDRDGVEELLDSLPDSP